MGEVFGVVVVVVVVVIVIFLVVLVVVIVRGWGGVPQTPGYYEGRGDLRRCR